MLSLTEAASILFFPGNGLHYVWLCGVRLGAARRGSGRGERTEEEAG